MLLVLVLAAPQMRGLLVLKLELELELELALALVRRWRRRCSHQRKRCLARFHWRLSAAASGISGASRGHFERRPRFVNSRPRFVNSRPRFVNSRPRFVTPDAEAARPCRSLCSCRACLVRRLGRRLCRCSQTARNRSSLRGRPSPGVKAPKDGESKPYDGLLEIARAIAVCPMILGECY